MEGVLNFNRVIDGIALGGGHLSVSSLARADTGDRLTPNGPRRTLHDH